MKLTKYHMMGIVLLICAVVIVISIAVLADANATDAALEDSAKIVSENTAAKATSSVALPEQKEQPEPYVLVNEEDVEMLACAIYCEAGGNECSDLCRRYVGDVILNRVNDGRFPNSIKDVLTQRGQYGRFYWTGIRWPKRAKAASEAAAVARAYDTARSLLSGNHSKIYGEGYIWQAEFKQGMDNIHLDGMYFGR